MFRFLVVSTVLLVFAHGAAAQNAHDLTAKLQTALKQNDASLALEIADELYDIGQTQNDHKSAGFAAFAKASVLDQQNNHLPAAKAYRQCAKHYGEMNSAAQSIQCEYKSGMSFLTGHKKGQAMDALRSAAKRLEKIGQDKSGLASQVYLTLANNTLPTKLERSPGATVKRLSAAEYADKSLVAMKATDQDNTESYAMALFMKGLAFEDAEHFEEAVQAYEEAVNLYETLPNISDDVIKNANSRLSIAMFGAGNELNSDTIDIRDISGKSITLEIEKTKSVKAPRVNRNRMVDGARARVAIKLGVDGEVSHIQILESTPSQEYGEALEKAVSKWKFTPPGGVSPADIPTFEYSMVFYVKRF